MDQENNKISLLVPITTIDFVLLVYINLINHKPLRP
jgi:hypothetical protein